MTELTKTPGRIRIAVNGAAHYRADTADTADTLCGRSADTVYTTESAAGCKACIKAYAKVTQEAADAVTVARGLERNAQRAAAERRREQRTGYTADQATRMELVRMAEAVGYTTEDAGNLGDRAYYATQAPCGDECERHTAMRRYDNGTCEACTVEEQYAEPPTTWCNYCPPASIAPADMSAAMSDGGIAHLCDGIMCRERCDDDGARVYGVLHDAEITRIAEAIRAELAAPHKATVTEHTLGSGVTVYGAICNCGSAQEDPRYRGIPHSSSMLTTAEDAIAVALGHGAVSRPRYKAPEAEADVVAEAEAEGMPRWPSPWVGELTIADVVTSIAPAGFRPVGDVLAELATVPEPEISAAGARITAVACEECGIMPHDMECVRGRMLAELAELPPVEVVVAEHNARVMVAGRRVSKVKPSARRRNRKGK